MKKIITKIATSFLILFFATGVAMAQSGPTTAGPGIQDEQDGNTAPPPGSELEGGTPFTGLENPIPAVTSIGGLVEKILDIVLIIGVPIIAFFIIYSGFLFVVARGNPEGLEKAKTTFIYTLIGGALLLGAWVLAQGIADTINSLK